MTPETFNPIIRSDIEVWRKIVKALNLQI